MMCRSNIICVLWWFTMVRQQVPVITTLWYWPVTAGSAAVTRASRTSMLLTLWLRRLASTCACTLEKVNIMMYICFCLHDFNSLCNIVTTVWMCCLTHMLHCCLVWCTDSSQASAVTVLQQADDIEPHVPLSSRRLTLPKVVLKIDYIVTTLWVKKQAMSSNPYIILDENSWANLHHFSLLRIFN